MIQKMQNCIFCFASGLLNLIEKLNYNLSYFTDMERHVGFFSQNTNTQSSSQGIKELGIWTYELQHERPDMTHTTQQQRFVQ